MLSGKIEKKIYLNCKISTMTINVHIEPPTHPLLSMPIATFNAILFFNYSLFQLATRQDTLKPTQSSLGCEKSRIVTRNCREKEDKNTSKSMDKDFFFLQLGQWSIS